MLLNVSECMMLCVDDSNDMCGVEGRMILYEIGKIEFYVIIVLFLIFLFRFRRISVIGLDICYSL